MIKPIFIVGIPYQEGINMLDDVQATLEKKLKEYHVLVYTHNNDNFIFNCFCDSDFEEKSYDEIKKFIEETMKKY